MKMLKAVPIFSAGKWNRMVFDVEDLDDIASNFQSLLKIHKVPLKLGHNKDQPMTDGLPALGWVANVRRVGDKLLADFTDVPTVLAKAIGKKLYRKVSIELLFDVKRGKETLRHVLSGVAILGADQPAVNNLGDLDQFLASRFTQLDSDGRRIEFETFAGNLSTNSGGSEMNEAEIRALMATLFAEFAAKNPPGMTAEQQADLAAANKRADEAERANAKFKADQADFDANQLKDKLKARREAIAEVFEAAIKAKAISPAQREAHESLIGLADDERVLSIDVEDLKKMFSVTIPREGSEGMNPGNENETDIFAEVDRRIRKYQSDHPKTDYAEASTAVFMADPAMHSEYLNTVPPQRFSMTTGGSA